MGRFIKTKNESFDKERKDELLKSQPVVDSKRKVVFVNGSKFKRAEEIVALIKGQKAVIKQEDQDRKEHYEKQLASHEISLDDPDVVPAVYELLGGLIRTINEHQEADKIARELKAKGKKKMIE